MIFTDEENEDTFDAASHWRGPWKAVNQKPGELFNDARSIVGLDNYLIAYDVEHETESLLLAAPSLFIACQEALREDSGLACAGQLKAALNKALGL